MNLSQIAMLQKFKSSMEQFRRSHPKFQPFINTVSKNALMEGTIIEIHVSTPEGKNYCSNIKLKKEDIELIHTLQDTSSHI